MNKNIILPLTNQTNKPQLTDAEKLIVIKSLVDRAKQYVNDISYGDEEKETKEFVLSVIEYISSPLN